MGYFGMFLMALIPQLWFKVMNPRLLAYKKSAVTPNFDPRLSKREYPGKAI